MCLCVERYAAISMENSKTRHENARTQTNDKEPEKYREKRKRYVPGPYTLHTDRKFRVHIHAYTDTVGFTSTFKTDSKSTTTKF